MKRPGLPPRRMSRPFSRRLGLVFSWWNTRFQWRVFNRQRECEMVLGLGVTSKPRRCQPPPGLFSFEPFPGLRRHNPAGGFYGPVSIRSAASEYIPLGGAVLLWNVPNSPIGGSFGVDAAAGTPSGEPSAGAGRLCPAIRAASPQCRAARAQVGASA